MIKLNDKKGIFFTLLTIIILSLFALSYSFLPDTGKRESVQKRIETLNNYVFTVEEDISRNLFVSGFRTTYITIEEIKDPLKLRNNFTNVFNESFFGGTYLGVEKNLMDGAKFSDMVFDLQNSSRKINANVTLENATVYVDQIDPWNIRFNLKARLIIEDLNKYVRWDKETLISSEIPIYYFNDPMYYKETKGNYANKMRKTIYNNLSDTGNITAHMRNSFYINNTDAPSFIDRIEGNYTGGNIFGIESIIDLDKLASIGQFNEINQNYSNVDYLFFTEEDDWCNVLTISLDRVRLDLDHRIFYSRTVCYN